MRCPGRRRTHYYCAAGHRKGIAGDRSGRTAQWLVATITLLLVASLAPRQLLPEPEATYNSLGYFHGQSQMEKIMIMRIHGFAGALAVALAMLSGACTVSSGQQGDSASRSAAMDADIDRALSQLAQQARGSDQLVASAKGVLVFPAVLSAGFMIGGSHGLGGLRKNGKTVRHFRMTAASVGLLAGARSKTVVYLFMTDEALSRFEASSGWTAGVDASVTVMTVGANAQIDTQSARQPVIGFVLTNAGLMGNLSMDGTRIAPTTL